MSNFNLLYLVGALSFLFLFSVVMDYLHPLDDPPKYIPHNTKKHDDDLVIND